MANLVLPDRNEPAETAFVAAWADSEDVEGLVEVITLAIEARRPQLAAQLFGQLDDKVEIPEGSALERAARAARLWLRSKPTPEDNSWSELEDAWRAVRKKRLNGIKRRWRKAMTGKSERFGTGRRGRRR